MTRGDLDGLLIMGRPLKPVALGLSLSMIVLTVFNTSDLGILRDAVIGDVVGIMAAISASCLIAGWVFRSQHMAEAGLFIAGLTMVLRSAFLFALVGIGNIGVWLGVGTAIVALGAFLLERVDENRGEWWPTSSLKG